MASDVDLPDDFGARVRAARAYKDDMSRHDLGRELGVSAGYIKNLEGGKKPDALKAQALIARLPQITDLSEAFFLGTEPNGDRLSELLEEMKAMRTETAARDAAMRQLLEDKLPPTGESQLRRRA